jgi:hypothetical protein
MPVILGTHEGEIRRILVWAIPGKQFMRLSIKYITLKGLLQWLKL